jgi:putative molybdopterin biosynthesis protein
MSSLQCRLRELRQARGLSLSGLATAIGLSRQALTAIEAGRSTPSTAIALRLAQVLGCRVEELFQLAGPLGISERPPGTRLVLGHIDGRWVEHALRPTSAQAADALVGHQGGIEALHDPLRLRGKVLLAGCAPVLGTLSARTERSGQPSSWLYAPSGQALRWLAEGRVHVAGMHLAPWDHPEQHEQLLREHMPGQDVVLISLLGWRQGLVLAPGNPLGLRDISDLDEAHRVAQRQPGSGAQSVLEAALGRTSSGPRVRSHTEAAQALRLGAADAAVLIEPVAQAFGLPFSPLSEERFELALRRDHLQHPGIVRLLDELGSLDFRREVAGMGAYDLSQAGHTRRVA